MSRLVDLARAATIRDVEPDAPMSPTPREVTGGDPGKPVEPSTEDKAFFRSILPGATVAKYAGADAEDRRAKVLDQLQDPAIKRAMALSPDGLVTVGVRFEGKVWTADLKIPGEFDPWLILEKFEKHTTH